MLFVLSTPVLLPAQAVMLQIRPHVGDTLSVRLDQEVEMVGVPVGCEFVSKSLKARKPADRNCADNERSMLTRSEIFSRAIARRTKGDATVMLAVTDSIRSASGTSRATIGRMTRLDRPRNAVEIKMSQDGGVELLDESASDELRSVFGQMPPTLSRKPVAVGEKWTREMLVPLAREPGASGRVLATFQLDSLRNNGDVAFISMRGELSHRHSDGSDSETGGSILATIQLNRRLGWITETRATIDVSSVVRGEGGRPMRVRTRITQLLRAAPAS
ncbi:MAG TPA: hypothetical protein VIF83_15500 [Gemmatimonadaceae bacterium]